MEPEVLIFKGALLSYQLLHAVYSFIINSLGRNSHLGFCFLFKLYFIYIYTFLLLTPKSCLMIVLVDWTPADLHNVSGSESTHGYFENKILAARGWSGIFAGKISLFALWDQKKSSATTEFVLLSSHRFVFFVSWLVIGCLVQSIELHVNWHKRAWSLNWWSHTYSNTLH